MTLLLALAAFVGLWGTSPAEKPEVAVAPLFCFLSETTVMSATVTRVGNLELTAKHALCPSSKPAYVGPNSSDLAILKPGPAPASCKDAKPGEAIAYTGYPATQTNGTPWGLSVRPAEKDRGQAAVSGLSFEACTEDQKVCSKLTGMSLGTSTQVRPGYSGGAVTSLEDGRLVGIVSAVSADGQFTYFVPISEICKALEEIP